MSIIVYTTDLEGISPEMLSGFFVGWKCPHNEERHLKILKSSDFVVLAIDTNRKKVVGFITCLTDGIQSAFIPLLEVLPAYQNSGIGSKLVERMLKLIANIPAIDLTCDKNLQPFYERFGMQRSVGMIIRNYCK